MEFDVIGIYMPPAELMEAYNRFEQGQLPADRLKEIEDEAVRDIVESQLTSGLKTVTSGGIRWKHWNTDFFYGLSGINKERFDSGHLYSSVAPFTDLLRFSGRISYNASHPYFEDFNFLADTVAGRAVCRQFLPSPTELYMQIILMSDGHPERLYVDTENLRSDIKEAYRKTIMRLYDSGCRSIVLDDAVCGRLCEDNFMKRLLQGGIDTVSLQDIVIELTNSVLAEMPSDLEKAVYLTGGDSIVPEWKYLRYPDNVIPRILSEVNADKLFIPFELSDDCSVEILRYVPEGKKIVLGLIDAHSPLADDEDAIIRFIEKARQYVKPNYVTISPKTGFRLSNFAPRGLQYNDQWSKIEFLAALINNHNIAFNEKYI